MKMLQNNQLPICRHWDKAFTFPTLQNGHLLFYSKLSTRQGILTHLSEQPGLDLCRFLDPSILRHFSSWPSSLCSPLLALMMWLFQTESDWTDFTTLPKPLLGYISDRHMPRVQKMSHCFHHSYSVTVWPFLKDWINSQNKSTLPLSRKQHALNILDLLFWPLVSVLYHIHLPSLEYLSISAATTHPL